MERRPKIAELDGRQSSTAVASEPSTLEKLHSAKDRLNFEHHRPFDSYFIGALSVVVAPEQWDRAIETAKSCVAKYENKGGAA